MGIDRHYPVLAGSVVCLSRMGVATGDETGSKTASPPGQHTFLSIPPGAGSDIGDSRMRSADMSVPATYARAAKPSPSGA